MKIFKKIINIQPLSSCKKILKKNYKLCDFYIASSYKSYLPCTNYYDYADLKSIEKCLEYGARYIDLDIFNKNFKECTEPVVCNGKEIGNWHFTNALSFDDCCSLISSVAFSNKVSGRNDPLFINLNLYTNGNIGTINKIAEKIIKHLGHKLLDSKYSYQGYSPNPKNYTNIMTTPIKNLINKVIIVCDNHKEFKGTDLDELVNICSNNIGNFRNMKYIDVKESYDPAELREFNKKNMTRVIPPINKRDKENINYNIPWYLGCQFICMNYNLADSYMHSYMRRFKECSFILKPYKLRYKPIFIEPPKKQIVEVSFAPEKVSTPFYSITY